MIHFRFETHTKDWRIACVALKPGGVAQLMAAIQRSLRHLIGGQHQLDVPIPTARYSRVVVLSRVDPDVVRRVLLCTGLRCAVHIEDDRQAPSMLCQMITLSGGRGRSSPEKWFGEILPYVPAQVFTRRERRALWNTLQEIPIHVQARTYCVSMKTIYNQRSGALFKLGAQNVLDLLRWFSPTNRPFIIGTAREIINTHPEGET